MLTLSRTVRDGSAVWNARARGWIRVMHVDILLAMVIFATVAFYLLGAGVLNELGLIPESSKMIENLSKMYTEMLGSAGLYLFFFGAIAVLYSTIFAATARSPFIVMTQVEYAARQRSKNVARVQPAE